MTVVSNLDMMNIVAILVKINKIESSDDSDKNSKIVDLLDSTQNSFNIDLDSHNLSLMPDLIEITSTDGSVLWQTMRDRYEELADY